MNAKNTLIAIVATLSISATSFADVGSRIVEHKKPSPVSIVANMIENYDLNNDGALNDLELAISIEDMFEHRNLAMRDRREAMIEKGFIAAEKADNGFVTLTPMPDEAAAFLMNGHDQNEDNVLQANELLASTRDFLQLNLGYRPGFACES